MTANPMMSLIMSLFSVILPTKMWFSPSQPITVRIDSKTASSLILEKFDGTVVGTKDAPTGDATVDLRSLFPQLSDLGTYVLFAAPKGKGPEDFEGTPVVIEVLAEAHQADPSVVRVEPLRYVVMDTQDGPMTMAFYYDVAPNTVDSFLRLCGQGFYDGLTFHRIIPNFVLQGGDPKGNGQGGPGYNVNAEFNAQPHETGVLSMARSNDVNSAGSQFFICLDYNQTKHLDNQYTAFGKVVDGTGTMDKLKATPLKADGETPVNPPVIKTAQVFPVTPGHNPYTAFGLGRKK